MSFVLLLFAEHAMAKEPVCGRVLCGGRGVPGVVVTDEGKVHANRFGTEPIDSYAERMPCMIYLRSGRLHGSGRGERSDVLIPGGHACRA